MSIERQLLATIRALPPERQKEVLDFAKFLTRRYSPLEQVLIDIRRRAEDIDQAELDALVEEAGQDFADQRLP